MGTTNPSRPSSPNRRAASRRLLRSNFHVECRKGNTGLGPNLTQSILNVSQTGISLILNACLQKKEDAEVILTGGSFATIKRMAEVIRSEPEEKGGFKVGLRFRQPLTSSELGQMTRPS